MKRKPPTVTNIGIDIDSEVLANFDCDYPVDLVSGCAHHYLADYPYIGTELIYCDLPYLAQTRTSSQSKYRFDYTEQEHSELLVVLKSLPCHVIVSGYPSSLYDGHLSDWNTLALQVMTRGGVRTEKRWFNDTIDRVH